MKSRILVVSLLALAVAACTKGWIPGSDGKGHGNKVAVLSAGPHSVVLGPVAGTGDTRARSLAEAHCRRYGLVAHLPRMVDADKVHFVCLQ